jgi:type I restriction enzyme, S subunit
MSFNFPTPQNWELVKLSSLGEVNRGRSRHRPRDAAHLYGGPYPFIQTGDVKASNGRIITYTQTYSEAGLQQSRLWPVGTMCITIAANIAETGILEFPACFPDSVIGFIPNLDKCDVYFIEYTFRLMRGRIQAQATGSVQDNINLQTLERIEFPLPRLEEQKAIAGVLCRFDDKIGLSRRINQTLEAMAQAIFNSWFVDFEPVKAKIAAIEQGEDPLRAAMRAISGKTDAELDQMSCESRDHLAVTATLFPDEMEASELDELPKGWAFQLAETLTEVGIGKTPPRKEPHWFTEGDGDWRWISIKDMSADGVFQQCSSEFLTAEAVSRFNVRIVPDHTVLLSFKLTVGRVTITDGFMVTNEAIANFKLPSNAKISSEYLYLYLKGFDYSTLGSTSSIADAVNSKTIREMPIIVANPDLIDRFTKAVTPLFEEIRNRQNEIVALSMVRDSLLPKLLSGEIEVPA